MIEYLTDIAVIYYSPPEDYRAALPVESREQISDKFAFPTGIASLGFSSSSTRAKIWFADS